MTARRSPRRWWTPGSFRARLTLSYTVLTATLASIALIALTALALQITIRQTMLAIDDVASSIHRSVETHWSEPDARIALLVGHEAPRAGVRVTTSLKRPSGLLPPPEDRGSAQKS